MTPADLLAGLAAELEAIEALAARGKAAFDADEHLRLALERRWITAGNYAERYRLETGLAPGTDPWTELYDFRCLLAHALPDQLDGSRVFDETILDIARLRSSVEAVRAAMSQ